MQKDSTPIPQDVLDKVIPISSEGVETVSLFSLHSAIVYGLVAVTVLIVGGAGILSYEYFESQKDQEAARRQIQINQEVVPTAIAQQPTSALPQATSTLIPTQSPSAVGFLQLLTDTCSSDSISSSAVPFTLSQQVIDRYSVVGSLPCRFSASSTEKMGGYINLRADDLDEGITHQLKIGTQESDDSGFEAGDFATLEGATPAFTHEGVSFFIDTPSIEPYGITHEQYVVRIKAFKNVNGYYIISNAVLLSAPEEDIQNLMTQYFDNVGGDAPNAIVTTAGEENFGNALQEKFIPSFSAADARYSALLEAVFADVQGVQF